MSKRALACAALLLLAPTLVGPMALAQTAPALVIVSPAAGEVVGEAVVVALDYAGATPGAGNVSGYVRLDGEAVATFTQPLANGTTRVRVPLDLAAVASGAHTLGAVAFTQRDLPVETAPVEFVLDHAPVGKLHASYDRAAQSLTLDVNVTDDGGSFDLAYATPLGNGTMSTAGPASIVLAGELRAGNHSASVVATDSRGATRSFAATFAVENLPSMIVLEEAAYLGGGWARVRGVASDPDGLRSVWIRVEDGKIANASLDEGGAFSATFPVPKRPGGVNVTVVASDLARGNTTASAHLAMPARHLVVYEHDSGNTTGIGAETAYVTPPPISHGTVSICMRSCARNGTYVAMPAAIVTWGQNADQRCFGVASGSTCAFATDGQTVMIAWEHAVERIQVRIEGWVID